MATFHATAAWEQDGATIFSGPAPFDFKTEDRVELFVGKDWLINHPETGQADVYRCIGVETFMPVHYYKGMEMALRVQRSLPP